MVLTKEINKYRAYSILREHMSFNTSDGDDKIIELANNLFERKIKNISGKKLLNSVISDVLENIYSEKYERFLFKRTFKIEEKAILYPYGFLINHSYLAYYNKECILINNLKTINELKKISEAIYYLQDIKRYSIYEYMNTTTPTTFGEDLSKDLLNFYFGFFPQYYLSYIELLLTDILKKKFIEYEKELEFQIVYDICQMIKEHNLLFDETLHLKNLYKKYQKKISKTEFYTFIDYFTYTKDKKDEKFDFVHLNYLFIKDGLDYKIPLKSMNIMGLYRQAYVYLSNINKNLSSNIGTDIESSVLKLFTEKNYNCSFGHWYDEINEEWYESDLILNLDKTIVLIEIKKASMKLKSKTGDIFNSLLDVNKAFLESQIQALRLKARLKKNNFVKLYTNKTKDSNYKELFLEDKRIITLSLTLEDFDILHCTSFCSNLIKNSLFIDKISTEPIQKEEKKLNKAISELKKINLDLEDLDNYNIDTRYHDLLFFNIQFLSCLLNNLDEPIELEKKLITFCSFVNNEDIYRTLEYIIKD